MSVYNDPRRTKAGWTKMGNFMLPILPLPVILTDRGDGSQWLISWNDTSGPDSVGRITLINDFSAGIRDGLRIYPAYEEPIIYFDGAKIYKLIVRTQHLGLEVVPLKQGEEGRNSPPVYARQTNSLDRRQIRTSIADHTMVAFTVDEDME